ncbi:DUF3892 domain-containing protein [Streptomyces geranii]|uniref:DUF3892 domain-containing protein n=1 Tax=Streptomyces geranii TaxID=2058923 RepID=UPI000D036959|nr:DUF3892 domain-containing protein [Streptomyces geranii]
MDGHLDDHAAGRDGCAEQGHGGDLLRVSEGGQQADGDHGQEGGKTGDNTRAQLVDWIENQGGKAYTSDRAGHRTEVAVVTPARGEKYLRTRADWVWTNNLLALPQR